MTQNLSAAQQTQLDNRDTGGQWKAKTHADVDDISDVLGIGSGAQGEPLHRAGDCVESFENISKNWPDSISVTSDSGPGGLVVTATHQPDMGTTVEFRAETDDDIEPFETGSWTYSVDGDVVAEGPLAGGDDEILTAEMHQDAFVSQAMDDDALSGMFDSLNQELGRRDGYQVSIGWHGAIDDHTERHDLRIDEPDGGAWEVIQLRHDPRVAHMDGGEGMQLFEAERGNRNYESEHYVSRINPDGTTDSLEGEESYESMDEAINEIRARSNNFGASA